MVSQDVSFSRTSAQANYKNYSHLSLRKMASERAGASHASLTLQPCNKISHFCLQFVDNCYDSKHRTIVEKGVVTRDITLLLQKMAHFGIECKNEPLVAVSPPLVKTL